MIHSIDPRQNRLFDPFDGVIPLAGRRIIGNGWQGVFRHVILEVLPVNELAQHFSDSLGAPTKELYSMAGLVFVSDFFGWTAQEAAEAYIFRSDVQFALNLEPGAEVSTRTVERYLKLFRENDIAVSVLENVTDQLVTALDLDVSRQRLDSTHVFSHMAIFGRTRLMAVAIKRFLIQLKRHDSVAYAALPDEFRKRYAPSQSRLFADAKDAAARDRYRQQVAEDLCFIIDRFADCEDLINRTTYKSLQTIFHQQCERSGKDVVLKAKTGGNCIQNPSDLDATYDAHKGAGYQLQITETCVPENEVQLITAALPQTACERDEDAFEPMADQLEKAGFLPAEMLADTHYTSDENVQAAAARGVDLVGPVPGRPVEAAKEALTVDDFAVDERTGNIDACPAGKQPLSSAYDTATETTRIEMSPADCTDCPFRAQCPINKSRAGEFTVEFTDKDRRLAGRRAEEQTSVFEERYAQRSGIESTNSGLKNRLGLGRLRVRGRGSVFRVLLHKAAGWNVLRAAASEKLRARVRERVAQTLKGSQSGLATQTRASITRVCSEIPMIIVASHGFLHRFERKCAA